jgi:hypothetical protein
MISLQSGKLYLLPPCHASSRLSCGRGGRDGGCDGCCGWC